MKEIILNIISIICTINVAVLIYLIYLYFKNKDNSLQDEGTTDTEQED